MKEKEKEELPADEGEEEEPFLSLVMGEEGAKNFLKQGSSQPTKDPKKKGDKSVDWSDMSDDGEESDVGSIEPLGEEVPAPAKLEEEGKKKKEKQSKKAVEPNKEMLDQLFLMGFPLEFAKKALVQVNNESIPAACEVVLELQEKEGKTAEGKEPKKKLILSWSCPQCTFINVEGRSTCELCDMAAPQSAYVFEKTEEEKKREAEEAQRKVEAEARLAEEKKQKEEEEEKRRVEEAERLRKEEEEKKKREEEEAKVRGVLEESQVVRYLLFENRAHLRSPLLTGCALSH